ncbi:hypothetical protein [Anaerococcus sp. Marseille-Q5996]|uniref:hypothetical protein n=1 Tax=Anaerococcus sp. Marseille-Q5996 TaxID=2972769 RepID=UPI0021C830B3|nr:hypothetical protein [Anaerococcus sp. Marseille-Q5996]
MARVIAVAYKNCIIRGIRVIDQVRPDELKKEVQDLLIAEGREDLAEVEKEEAKEETPIDKKEDEAPTDSTEEKEEPIKDDETKEDKEG